MTAFLTLFGLLTAVALLIAYAIEKNDIKF